MTNQLSGIRYDTNEPVTVTWEGDRITALEPLGTEVKDGEKLPYLAPGLFDIQINGYGGIWFCKEGLTTEDVASALKPYLAAGVTQLFPTLITSSHAALVAGFSAIRQACEKHPWIDRMVPGCHLEGPYLADEDGPRGAHPLEHIRPADWNEFSKLQELSGNRIKLITVAPECEGVLDFIPKAVESGVVVSIGHTAATPEQIVAAADAGATMSTHLGNGAHGMLRRHPNYLWEQLADDRLICCLITDGHHVPASFIKTALRTKTPNRTLITCDASGLAGLPAGTYESDTLNVEILDDGKIVLAGQTQLLAGSGATTEMCVAQAVALVEEISLSMAIDFASKKPGEIFNVEVGEFLIGGLADLIQFDFEGPGSEIHIRKTIAQGELVFEKG